MGIQHRRHTARTTQRRRQQSSQRKTIPQVDRTLQNRRYWPLSSGYTQPDERPLGDKLLYLDLPSNLSDPAAKLRVTVTRCKPCANPYDADDMPRHLPGGLAQYVLHAFATKSPPYYVTTDDIATPSILTDVAKITGHQCVRGRGGCDSRSLRNTLG